MCVRKSVLVAHRVEKIIIYLNLDSVVFLSRNPQPIRETYV